MIFNRGKPRHARPRRPWATMLATLLTTIALVFVPGTALADSGMDVSKWQGCVGSSQAATAKASGVNFAFVKVTEGNGYTDSVADCTMQSLKANGIRRGVYHFARPDLGNSPEAEADWFIGQTRGYVNDGVIPVLDWEPSGSYVTWSWWALRWLQRVESAWGVKPLIYTSASVIKMTDWTAVANANYGLWVAGYPRGYTGETLRNRSRALRRQPLAIRRRLAVFQLGSRAWRRFQDRRQLVLWRCRNMGEVRGFSARHLRQPGHAQPDTPARCAGR